MTYETAKDSQFATGTCPDGYFGNRAECGFAFEAESGHTLIVTPTGYFPSLLPSAIDAKEAAWLLSNHPTGKRYYTVNH